MQAGLLSQSALGGTVIVPVAVGVVVGLVDVDPPGFIGLVESSALYTVPPSYSTVHDGTRQV